jgi:hypothetical protein
VKVSTRLCSVPCSPAFLVTSLTRMVGGSFTLYLNGKRADKLVFVEIKDGYSKNFFSNIFGTMEMEKKVRIFLLGIA